MSGRPGGMGWKSRSPRALAREGCDEKIRASAGLTGQDYAKLHLTAACSELATGPARVTSLRKPTTPCIFGIGLLGAALALGPSLAWAQNPPPLPIPREQTARNPGASGPRVERRRQVSGRDGARHPVSRHRRDELRDAAQPAAGEAGRTAGPRLAARIDQSAVLHRTVFHACTWRLRRPSPAASPSPLSPRRITSMATSTSKG